jgi:2-polyprenyl-3-methyl-5-hydroxy-6-metoxy-1,4-benzoquinol methylase
MCRCPICLCEERSEIGQNPDFPLSKVLSCMACGFMWTHPAPSEAYLNDLYKADYREMRSEGPDQKYLTSMDNRAAAQKSFILEHTNVALHQAKILDVGCSAGSLLSVFTEFTHDLTGFEPDEKMVAAARSRLPASAHLHTETFALEEFPDDTFHLVTASHVLEHVPEPVSFLSELFRIVCRNGALFLEVPYETKRKVRELVRRKRKGTKHLLFFSPGTLKKAVTRAGGRVVYMSRFGPDIRLRYCSWRTRRIGWYAGAVTRRISRYLGAECSGYDHHIEENPQKGTWIRVIAERAINE